jgi:homoserine dehydrogenase
MSVHNKPFKVAILGCGTVGGGVARILSELRHDLARRASRALELYRIVTPHPVSAANRHGLPMDLFEKTAAEISHAECARQTDRLLANPDIDLIVEAIGGSSDILAGLCTRIMESGKHLVTANKALLASHGDSLLAVAGRTGRILAFEAAVCGAIPVIRTVEQGFAGDVIKSVSGIMNGTSNYILTRMQEENLSFESALLLAQEAGYAEADPRFDVEGTDAGHKLVILAHLAFGSSFNNRALTVNGISSVEQPDILIARELGCTIKLICHALWKDNAVYSAVTPMLVRESNRLSGIGGATNALLFVNRYSGEHFLVGKGAGSLETGSAIVADIVAIARQSQTMPTSMPGSPPDQRNLDELDFPYTIIFDMDDVPGITGMVTTAIGETGINIDTVGHNVRGQQTAIFCIETMPCPRSSIDKAIALMKGRRPEVFRSEPKVYPVLY